jgi:hypothetical protein
MTGWADIRAELARRDPHLETCLAREGLLLALKLRLYRLRRRLRTTP